LIPQIGQMSACPATGSLRKVIHLSARPLLFFRIGQQNISDMSIQNSIIRRVALTVSGATLPLAGPSRTPAAAFARRAASTSSEAEASSSSTSLPPTLHPY
jgi:hypothetical protein